MTSPMIKN